ncbi:UNVERIFIED_ORG: 5-methylcytosine-specific restriction endonuclease McrA [Arthrobacter sp. UYEF1]
MSWEALQKPTKHQLAGETPREHRARVIKEKRLGYRGIKAIQWKRVRDDYLKTQINDEGWYICSTQNGYGCGRWIQEPEVDHIIKRSVRPDLVLEPTNFQILCHPCHQIKDNGMKFKEAA